MPPEIIRSQSHRERSHITGSRLVNFVKNILVLFENGAKNNYWGVLFKRCLLRFLASDLVHGRISPLEVYRYVTCAVVSTRYLETDFLYENLQHLSHCRNYLDVSSPRVVPYFLLRHLRLEHATLCNPDAADLASSQRSVGVAGKNIDFRSVRLEEIDQGKKFDLITSVSVVEHISPDQTLQFLSNMQALLAPGGLCLLTFPCACTEIFEYSDVGAYLTQPFDRNIQAYFFQRYFTREAVELEILPNFDEVVANKIFGEREKGQFLEYGERQETNPSHSSSQEIKRISMIFSEFGSIDELPGLGVCCYLLKKANKERGAKGIRQQS